MNSMRSELVECSKEQVFGGLQLLSAVLRASFLKLIPIVE